MDAGPSSAKGYEAHTMSAAFVPFLFELRARKVKVGAQEAMALARALLLELHESSLTGFYHVARALCVHRETDLDAFDQAFSAHFRGVHIESLSLVDELEQWLRDPIRARELTAEERETLKSLDMEELRRLFEERLREQRERHDGGNRWIGTGGKSPFGTGGFHPSGLRVGGGGARSAMGVADARRYRGYRGDLVLDVRQMEVALRKLRAFVREGAHDEFDIEGTIDKTAKNAGELEIVTRPPRKSNVRLVLLMDVGGSMDPYADIVSRLFSAAKRASNIRSLKSYYFHNCIYGHVYETERFTQPIRISELFDSTSPEWKLVLVGDAAMHPAELMGAGDWEHYAQGGQSDARRGVDWMRTLADHYHKVAWLNPDPPSYWRSGTAEMLSGIFPMFSLTLDGLGEAVTWLTKGTRSNR